VSKTATKPVISEALYQELLRKSFGEELAAICNLPYEERVRAVEEFQQKFDTPHDLVWPAEGYTGPDLP
jgi:cytochrome c peroxidase